MTDLRIGVLGCGRIGRMHADLIAEPRRRCVSLSVVYDVDRRDAATEAVDGTGAQRRRLARGAHRRRRRRRGRRSARRPTPTSTSWSRRLRPGKPVFIEKPLSLDLGRGRSWRRGRRGCRHRGAGRLQPSLRPEPPARSRPGDERAMSATSTSCRITSRDPAPPPIAYVEVSGGIFNDMTIHDFDMARFVTGSEVVDVFAHGAVLGSTRRSARPVTSTPPSSRCVTRTARSPRSTTRARPCTATTSASRCSGRAAWRCPTTRSPPPPSYRNADGGHQSTVPYFFLDRYVPSYIAEWEAFVAMVRDGAPSPVTIARRSRSARARPGGRPVGARGPPRSPSARWG